MTENKKPEWLEKIIEERIIILFKLANEFLDKNEKRSKRYIQLSRKIATRHRMKLPKKLKRNFCKKCNILFTDKNTIKRKNNQINKIIFKCKKCDY